MIILLLIISITALVMACIAFSRTFKSNRESYSDKKRVLVLFVFHKYNERVRKFIDNAIFKDDNTDFMIICNDKNIVYDCPKYVIKKFRDNIGYDFGGWSDGVLDNDLYKKYDYFIFVNSSVSGPFLKKNFKGKWVDIYIEGLKNNIKLFGSTINTISEPYNKAHVQSYIFAMDKETLKYLIDSEIFSKTNIAKNFIDAVNNKEILMSRKIIERGWNIGSLLPLYKNIDFTFKNKKFEEYNISSYGDLMYSRYRNKIWNEYDLVFIKGNRDVACS